MEMNNMEMARITSKGQITVPVGVRRRLGLVEGSRLLFIERDNGFFVVTESHLNASLLGMSKTVLDNQRWSENYAAAVRAFGESPDPTFAELSDAEWADRGELF
jgi:AbrB family looped-hinge helix DNA binding protein